MIHDSTDSYNWIGGFTTTWISFYTIKENILENCLLIDNNFWVNLHIISKLTSYQSGLYQIPKKQKNRPKTLEVIQALSAL